jgi:hypothetical protein
MRAGWVKSENCRRLLRQWHNGAWMSGMAQDNGTNAKGATQGLAKARQKEEATGAAAKTEAHRP